MTDNSIINEESTGTANIKLRASCNACHESKVRCTQTKPTCVRCERNGLVCVYGLSRRTHKDAPRILTSSRRSSSASSRCPRRQQQQQQQVKECPITPNLMDMPPIINFLGDQTATAAFNCTSELLIPSDIMARLTHGSGNNHAGFPLTTTDRTELNISGASWSVDGAGNQPFADRMDEGSWSFDVHAPLMQTSPNAHEQAQPQQQQQPFQDVQHQQDRDQGVDLEMRGTFNGLDEPECSCSPEAVPVLARTSPLFNRRANQRLPFDIELSQIKRAITGCEASANCQPHASDPNMAMMMGVMIGGIINGFEMLLANDAHPSTENHQNQRSSSTPVTAPSADGQLRDATNNGTKSRSADLDSAVTASRLSWGVLQLEDDDEADLRLRLCVLYFRRLETLLKHFNRSVRLFREAQDDEAATLRSSPAQVMACDYMRIWLEQKAETVRLGLSKRQAD